MESRKEKRRFPPPWPVEKTGAGYIVKDSNGVILARIYCPHDQNGDIWDPNHLTADEARRIANAIARIPEFMRTYPDFVPRSPQRCGRYWKSSHPFHVALQDAYVRENYDEIVSCCRYNGVPYEPTGEKIGRGAMWLTYEFARQFDAIRFWDKFRGQWLQENEFISPTLPSDFPRMKSLGHKGAI